MRRSGDLLRALTFTALCAAGLGACRDNGLPGKNMPLAEARHKTFRYLAYQPTTSNTALSFAGGT